MNETENKTTNNETSESQNLNLKYKEKTLDEKNHYVEILYQDNDWTYYINQKNFIDSIILIIFILFFTFTLVSLSINFFNLWRK